MNHKNCKSHTVRLTRLTAIITATACLLLSGCTGLSGFPGTAGNCQPDKALLAERINTFWQFKLDDRWGDAYEMTSKAFQKTIQKADYGRKNNIKVQSFDIKELKLSESVDPQVADAVVTFKVNYMGIPFPFDDESRWVFENCNWYMLENK